jgi:ABC-2 type transport system ATP-binding protein
MIVVEHLTKRYGPRPAVEDVSFSVNKGEIVGFLGPNGAGKSTTLRMLTGFLAPTMGAIRIDGIDALDRPIEAKKRIGYMPEAAPLYPEMRVREYLRYRAELKGVVRRHIGESVERALQQASVMEAADRIIGQLSKGTRQRVGLADALVADPPILVLDEPTAGLDPNQIRQVRSLVRSLAGQKTVLVSTHILPEVEATCDRVVIIHRGRVVREGTTSELRRAVGDAILVVDGRAKEGDAVTRFRAVLEEIESAELIGIEAMGDSLVRARLRLRSSASESDDVSPDMIAERVFSAVAKTDLVLRALHPETGGSLEEVFSRLTMDEGHSSAKDAEEDEAP